MASAMRKMAVYLGLVEDDHRFDEHYQDEYSDEYDDYGADLVQPDDGPDLHGLDVSDEWIANRIRKGKAGQMTAFAGKLQPAEIAALVAYVQSLK